MACKIIVKKRFTNKVKNLLLYLEKAWNEDVAADFILKLDKQIERVHLRPHTGIQIKILKTLVQF